MHQRKFFARAVVSVLLATAFSTGTAWAAPTLSIVGPTSATIGSSWGVQVRASDVSDLYGYQFDLNFDASKFQAQGATEGVFLQSAGATFFDGGTIDNAAGSISFVFDTLLGAGPGVTGSGILAEFSFTAVTSGSGLFSLANVAAIDSSLADIGAQTEALLVNAVPEPATLALCLAGLGATLMRRTPKNERALAPAVS